MAGSYFAPIPGPTREQLDSGKLRLLTGDGTAFLRAPGLKTLTAVRVGTMDIPLEQEMEFPDKGNKDKRIFANWPMIHIAHDADGTPVLQRAPMSNNGLWQKGVSITVIGDRWQSSPKRGIRCHIASRVIRKR